MFSYLILSKEFIKMIKYSEIIKAKSKINKYKFPHCYNILKHLVRYLQIISI